MKRLKTFLNIFAPIYFLIISGVRCYLESRVFTDYDFFSYYLLSHHTLWFMTSLLTVILFLSVYLKRPVSDLLWLFYGGTIIFIPVLYAYLFDVHMNLEYFSGTFKEIVGYSLTAAYKFTRNRPQFFAIIVLDIGIFITGYLYTKSVTKALITLAGTHFLLTVVGTKWFGKHPKTTAVFRIGTQFSGQEYMSLIYLISSTALSMILLIKENAKIIGYKFLSINLILSTGAWGIYSTLFYHFKIYRSFFDSFSPGILIFTIMFTLLLLVRRRTVYFTAYIFSGLFLIMLVQMYVVFPLLKFHFKF